MDAPFFYPEIFLAILAPALMKGFSITLNITYDKQTDIVKDDIYRGNDLILVLSPIV